MPACPARAGSEALLTLRVNPLQIPRNPPCINSSPGHFRTGVFNSTRAHKILNIYFRGCSGAFVPRRNFLGSGTSWHLHHQLLISENSLGINRNTSPTSINPNSLGDKQKYLPKPTKSWGICCSRSWGWNKIPASPTSPCPDILKGKNWGENEEILGKKNKINNSHLSAHHLGRFIRV